MSRILMLCFFKQKTAYEMRISVWSSDVCASDLFIVQDVLPLLTPGERTALVHASMLDTDDTDILSGIAGQRDDGRIIAEIAFRLRGLVDQQARQLLLERALRIWLRDEVEAFKGRRRAGVHVARVGRCCGKGRMGGAGGLQGK